MLSLREILDGLSAATLLQGAAETRIEGVSTDSRTLQAGDLFIALEGEQFDGHAYLEAACGKGARALIVSRKVESSLPAIIVPNTRVALGELALLWRRRFALPVIAVVGSNGKTTTKEMIASILHSAYGEDMLATRGNFNNDIGVPLTLLRLKTRHRAAVIEIGMNHPGETKWLAAITEPTICVVTNAQREHQEFMQSVSAVAHEHALALAALPTDGVAVLPAADAQLQIWKDAAGERTVIDYVALATSDAESAEPAVSAHGLYAVAYVEPFDTVAHLTYGESTITVHLATAGLHNVHNAAAAASAAFAAGIDAQSISQGLEHFAPVRGRMQRLQSIHGGLLIDDTYNANPDSVLAAMGVLAASPAPHLLILGDMGEVGCHGAAYHEEIGRRADALGLRLMAIGELSRHAVAVHGNANHFASVEELIAAANAFATDQQGAPSVLIKGSRFMRMERVVEALGEGARSLLEESH